jgi:hypothetical protein
VAGRLATWPGRRACLALDAWATADALAGGVGLRRGSASSSRVKFFFGRGGAEGTPPPASNTVSKLKRLWAMSVGHQ